MKALKTQGLSGKGFSSTSMGLNPFPDDNVKEFADDNFRFDENDGKFSKRVLNTMEKGEIAHYEQFLIFPPCFLKTCTEDT